VRSITHRKFQIPLAIGLLAAVPAFSQEEIRTDIPSWTEIEALDSVDAPIKRFAFTARGVAGQEFEIPGSARLFCTLNQDYNVVLNYYPATDTWKFQIRLNPSAQFAAGGIATCLDLRPRTAGRSS
jgi:hypothetical protein